MESGETDHLLADYVDSGDSVNEQLPLNQRIEALRVEIVEHEREIINLKIALKNRCDALNASKKLQEQLLYRRRVENLKQTQETQK